MKPISKFCTIGAALLLVAVLLIAPAMAAASTSVHIVRYANDGTTILNETTVTYQWMEANLTVYGDDVTQWYLQGPVYPTYGPDRWDPTENLNLKNWGRNKGTDVKDLCDLVGGAKSGETIRIIANDGLSRTFPYLNVYSPDPRQGRMVLAWWYNDTYVPSFDSGIRLIFLSDTSTNPSGYHCYGVWDMNQTLPSAYYYFNYDTSYGGDPLYPSTTGLSAKWVDRIYILSNDPAPLRANFSANVTSGQAPLSVRFNDTSAGGPTSWAWDFNNDGSVDSNDQNPIWTYDNIGKYTVNLTVSKDSESDTEVKPDYISATSAPAVVIFSGTVILSNGNFTWIDNTGAGHTVNNLTPHAALQAASQAGGFTYNGSWHSGRNTALLDWINSGASNYTYNGTPTPKITWNYQKNGIYQNYFSTTTGISNNNVTNGDFLEFYYGPDQQTTSNATAVVRIRINTGTTPADWSLSLKGARNQTVTKTYFEQGLACLSSGHMVNWTDADGSEWSGVPLWLLVAMVDDNPDVGPDHFNFNNTLAAHGYSVKVTAGDGYNTTLASGDIARNSGYIVANKLNGTDLPLLTPGGKLSWPLHLKGSAVFGGQQVGNITSIELTGMPQPSLGWTLTMEGDVVDVISQQYFEQAIVCHHNVTYTDASGSVWTGVPLWDLVGAADDIETTSHWTFNDTRANVTGYTVRVIAGDGVNTTFASLTVSHNNGFIVANTLNGTPLSGTKAPLRLVGPAIASKSQMIGNITKIRLESLPSYPAGAYSLSLKGKISDLIPQTELESWIAENTATYTDDTGNQYSGIPLWYLLGWVDDRVPAGPNGFNEATASAGYKVIMKAGDGYSKEFSSMTIGKNNNFIIANTLNGTPLPTTGSHPPWPLRLVGLGATGSNSVGNIVEIELTDFSTVQTATPLHIIKYGPNGITIINQTNVTYQWMETNLPVIGDGITAYKFEGLTLNSSNLWDPEETYPGGFKISNVVKGTRVHDLAELVGGMGSGTTITFVASDGFETTLPYSSIYTNPAVQARQGDAVIAWWGDGQYVPGYADGMRLFFMPSDHVYGQWDMHETLPSAYWRYNYQEGVLYPSCAGLSAKYITEIKVYSTPVLDWSLELDGRDIGGINYTVSKPYFEEALACQFGSNHSATYTDGSGKVWEGMPLWFLCGFVDDADMHTANSYNESKALAGYNITITGTDGYNYTFDSRNTVRSNNYIVANTLNGTHIPDTDSSWPLRLVGQNVSGGKIVKKIASIKLTPLAPLPPGTPTISFVPVSQSFPVTTSREYQIVINTLPNGLAGYDLIFTISNTSVAEIISASYPSWAGISNTTGYTAWSMRLSGVDQDKLVQAGATNVVLANITIRGDAIGTTPLIISNVHMDADGGAPITPALANGQAIVYSPLIANFSGTPRSGMASRNVSLDVNFTDLTVGTPNATTWQWNFGTVGSGNTSSLQNPQAHYYGVIGSISSSNLQRLYGNHTVTLVASNAYNQATMVKTDYIYITPLLKPFPGYTSLPTDKNGDWIMEDINGNGRLDYDDVVVYYNSMQWIRDQADVGIEPYDYNNNGRIDYDDVVVLYWIVLEIP